MDKLKVKGFANPTFQTLSDRKACDVVKKLPKGGVALCIVDSAPEGMCSAAKKLLRNMTVDLDKQCLKEKGVRFAVLTIATCSSAAEQKTKIEQHAAAMVKAFDRVGACLLDGVPSFLDAGASDAEPVLDEICVSLGCVSSGPSPRDEL